MFRKKYSFSDSGSRADSNSVFLSTGSLLINHEEEMMEGEAGFFEQLSAWDAEAVTVFRAFLSKNGAVLANFEETDRPIRDRKRRRFEAVTAALADFAQFYEEQRCEDGLLFTPLGIIARWECSFAL